VKPAEFVKLYLPYARQSEKKTGISAVFTLAQAAVESEWGDVAPGNMFFGVKDTDGINGNEQLLRTTEYSHRSDLQFPVILSVKPVILRGQKYFKYRVKDYFRKYETPGDCFDDHATFFYKNPRYRNALGVAGDPFQFAIQVSKAGYATDPSYQDTLIKVIRMIEAEIDKLEKPWASYGK
jgi:flagellum-specific peptidoglycan hydrolase FlgJ